MELNRDYYTGDITLVSGDNGIKRANTFYQLGQDGILNPNTRIDDSLWLFACPNDPLSVGMFLCGEKYGSTSDADFRTEWRLSLHTFRPPLNHYTVTWGEQAASGSPQSSWNFFAGGIPRIGNNATLSNLPKVAPISAIATKYCILYIECFVRTITAIEPIGALNIQDENHILITDNIYSFTNGTWVAYHTFLENVNDNTVTMGNNVGDTVVTAMRATFYSGTATSRNTARGGFVRLGFDYGGTAINNPFWDNGRHVDYVQANNNIYISRNIIGGSSGTMEQGGVFSISVYNSEEYNNGRNSADTAFGFQCNPSFWHIMSTSVATNGLTLGFTFAIIDKLSLQSAFAAYRATGFYFTGTLSTAENGNLDHPDTCPDLHRGVVDENGGVHTQADGHTDPDHPGLTDDPDKMHTVTGYDGDDNIDPNPYVDDTPLTKPNLQAINVFNRTYAVTATQLRALADFLWNADDDIFTLIKEGLSLMGENPMNALIDCRLYPFDVTTLLNSSGSEQIVLGRVNTETYGRRLTSYESAIINLGSCTFFKKFKNFLDYSPYTVARLYLPYCGIVEIDTQEFMGHEITVKMVIDVITGACTCFVYKDGIICLKSNGVIGVGIPMSGTDSASYANTILGNTIDSVTNILSGAAGILGGSATKSTGLTPKHISDDFRSGLGVIEGFSKLYQNYQTPLSISSSGSASPSSENWLPQYPYFIIDEPIPNAPAGYGHSVGFACYETKSLSNYSGYTECSNVDTSGFSQATESERAELKMLLESGVFL